MISTPVVISDVRIPLLFIYTEENLKIINEYNITGFPITWIQIQHVIFRLIINPLEETIQTIQQQLFLLEPMENVLGIHIRCAGLLADQKERVAMIRSIELVQLPSHIRRIAQLIKQPIQNITIFLSTDSSIAEKFLKIVLADYHVHVFNPFRRGHTTGGRANYLTIQQAIVDMYLLSQVKAFISTSYSGFSMSCHSLNSMPFLYRINITKTKVVL